jgi:Holliday junction resolvase-like predicted endonuclease
MIIERQILVSLLKLTRQGPFRKELLSKDSRVPMQVVDKILEKLCRDGLCQQRRGVVEASPTQRVKVAIHAIQRGADFERVCRFLQWKEFENLAAEGFKANNYNVRSNFRFKHAEKRWEIDLLAYKKPLIVCVDCKHWHHGWSRAAIVKAVEMQIRRTKALADAFPMVYEKIGLQSWNRALFVPTVLSLTQGPFRFHRKVPIVPVLKLQNFLNELLAHTPSLTHFLIEIKFKKHKLTKYLQ